MGVKLGACVSFEEWKPLSEGFGASADGKFEAQQPIAAIALK